MKKKFAVFGCASLFIGLLFCFVSCGEGTIDPLDDEFYAEHDIIEDGLIGMCFVNQAGQTEEIKESCRSIIREVCGEEGEYCSPSSDSEGEPSSSSDSEVEPSSSTGSPNPSSSSTDSPNPSSSSRPSSSSNAGTPSSSGGGTQSSPSGGDGGACEAGQTPGNINFTCAWSPRSVVSGKKTKPVIEISSPDGGSCAKNVSLTVEAGIRNYKVNFSDGVEYSTGSTDCLPTSGSSDFCWPVPTQSKDEVLAIKASVTCGINCKEIECPLTLTSSPKPIVNGSITCDWPILSGNGTNKYLSIGADLPDCTGDVSIENPGEDDADCGEVTYEISGSTSAAGKVYGRAVATCSKSKVTLKEYEAEVVADPVLGACTWKDNKTVLAKGQEATPSSELSNGYGRCGKVEFSGGFPRVLTESDVGAVKVTASADCGEKGTIEKACPDLEVKSAIYELKKENDKITLPNEATVIEMDLPSSWKVGNGGSPCGASCDATFFCQVDRQGGDGKVSGTIGTGTSAVSISGSDYATAKIPFTWTTGKYSLQVDIKCSNSCSCGVGN